jgi:hypothetical protein
MCGHENFITSDHGCGKTLVLVEYLNHNYEGEVEEGDEHAAALAGVSAQAPAGSRNRNPFAPIYAPPRQSSSSSSSPLSTSASTSAGGTTAEEDTVSSTGTANDPEPAFYVPAAEGGHGAAGPGGHFRGGRKTVRIYTIRLTTSLVNAHMKSIVKNVHSKRCIMHQR